MKSTKQQPTSCYLFPLMNPTNWMFHFRVVLSLRCWCLRAGDSEDVEGSWTWGRKGWDWKLPGFGARFSRFAPVYHSYHLTRPGTSVQRVSFCRFSSFGDRQNRLVVIMYRRIGQGIKGIPKGLTGRCRMMKVVARFACSQMCTISTHFLGSLCLMRKWSTDEYFLY